MQHSRSAWLCAGFWFLSTTVSAATSSYIFAMSHDQRGSTKFSHSLVPKRVNWIVATFSFIFWSSHLLPILAWLFGSVFLLYLHFCPPSTSQDFFFFFSPHLFLPLCLHLPILCSGSQLSKQGYLIKTFYVTEPSHNLHHLPLRSRVIISGFSPEISEKRPAKLWPGGNSSRPRRQPKFLNKVSAPRCQSAPRVLLQHIKWHDTSWSWSRMNIKRKAAGAVTALCSWHRNLWSDMTRCMKGERLLWSFLSGNRETQDSSIHNLGGSAYRKDIFSYSKSGSFLSLTKIVKQ